MAAVITEEKWLLAFDVVKNQFESEEIIPEQKEAIRSFFEGKNVFVNLPVGFGKSLTFQCLPIVADVIHEKPRGSSVVVVISPLRSLMEDQVKYLNNLSIPAIAITDEEDPETIQQVLNGIYLVVFGSPECLLSTDVCRTPFNGVRQTQTCRLADLQTCRLADCRLADPQTCRLAFSN